MSVAIECVAPVGSVVGEGPVWDQRSGTLYWVDIKAPALYATDVAARETRRWPMPERIGAVSLRQGPGLVAALKSGFAFIDLPAGTVRPIADPESDRPGNRFNDGKVDPMGRFWAGSMDDAEREPTGHLYRLDPDLRVTRFEIGFVCTNGIDWSGDGRTLYFTDTFERRIHAYRFERERGSLGARRLFAKVPEGQGYPDGLTVDAEDHVWGAHWGGGRVTRYRPDGSIERVLEFPVPLTSSCCFGGPGLETLYVTTASINLDEEARRKAPLSGGLFAVTGLGVRGRPSVRFRG
jgi:sugar lactone lactonase YvrE